jgi:hypothetical protein
MSQSQSNIANDGHSACLSWCWAPSGAHDEILITVWQLLSCPWEGALSDERTAIPRGPGPSIYILYTDHIENIFHSYITIQLPNKRL